MALARWTAKKISTLAFTSILYTANSLLTTSNLRSPSPNFYHRRTSGGRSFSMASTDIVPGRPTWQQTMLRIKDPSETLPFYTDLLGFTLIDKMDFPQWKFSLYFLTTLPEGETYTLTPGTQASHEYLWNMYV